MVATFFHTRVSTLDSPLSLWASHFSAYSSARSPWRKALVRTAQVASWRVRLRCCCNSLRVRAHCAPTASRLLRSSSRLPCPPLSAVRAAQPRRKRSAAAVELLLTLLRMSDRMGVSTQIPPPCKLSLPLPLPLICPRRQRPLPPLCHTHTQRGFAPLHLVMLGCCSVVSACVETDEQTNRGSVLFFPPRLGLCACVEDSPC